ncbi:MAG: hypothetical protein WD250_01395 [Egibacteraceae bacterium]
MSRRDFFVSGRRGAGLVLFSGGASALLAACATDEPAVTGPTSDPTTPADGDDVEPEETAPAQVEGTAIVDDVIDFALESDDWTGPFGFVTFRMHRALANGNDLYYIRTDASDPDYAREHGLVAVPKIGVLAEEGLVVKAYFPAEDADDGQPTLVSSEPGLDDYTSAWQVHRYRWTDEVGDLTSVEDLEAAAADGAVEIEETDVVLNASAVQWAGGSLPVDEEFTDYLGSGQLVEPPDTDAMTVTFKLHECYPNVRYIVTDTALAPMAEGMAIAHTPALQGASEAGATGRTNVFMNGLEGPGPMGFQPSVFDTQAGDPEWSPYWDHMTYAWADDVEPTALETEEAVHAARDAGDLEEFPGTPDTDGETFVVNCPVPVLADNTFKA